MFDIFFWALISPEIVQQMFLSSSDTALLRIVGLRVSAYLQDLLLCALSRQQAED